MFVMIVYRPLYTFTFRHRKILILINWPHKNLKKMY